MTTKVCFKCLSSIPINLFYRHCGMKDGHLNKCIECTKKDSKEREDELKNNPDWIKSERQRHRDKYYRLNYKEKHKPTPEKKKETIQRYKERYPEKIQAHSRMGNLKPKVKGNHLHHWSYNEGHYKDVIELSESDHNFLHRHIIYDQERRMYRTKEGVLLDTRESHIQYYNSLK